MKFNIYTETETATSAMANIDLTQVPDFTGKVLSISTMDDDSSHDIADPGFEMQAGRLFIVGSTPDGASGIQLVRWCKIGCCMGQSDRLIHIRFARTVCGRNQNQQESQCKGR